MGWPEEPTDWGAPGHVDRGDEFEAIKDQIRRLSGPVTGVRYVTGAVIAAGIAGTESSSNISTGQGRFESGRRYKVKMKLHLQTSDTTSVFSIRARVGSLAGTQIDYFQWIGQNTGLGFWVTHEMDFTPSADLLDVVLLTGQRVSGAGTIDFEAGSTTSPVYLEVWEAGHTTDVTTVS
jgi:hypothetical protein